MGSRDGAHARLQPVDGARSPGGVHLGQRREARHVDGQNGGDPLLARQRHRPSRREGYTAKRVWQAAERTRKDYLSAQLSHNFLNWENVG